MLEDNDEIRNTLVSLLNSHENLHCIADFDNPSDAVRSLPRLKPDVVLVDIHMPGGSGIEAIRQLKPILPETQFIVFSVFEENDNIFDALTAGATGYLVKSTPPDKIIEAIHEVHQGGSPMSSRIARKIVANFQTKKSEAKQLEILTAREQEILNYLSKGFRYKEIASSMFISIETVRTHIRNIYEKLQVSSRTDALNKVFGK
jgi:DNA-binding NarL/FixJ family response regulator